MASWIEENDFWKISYVTHDKIPVNARISVRIGSINVKDLNSIKHARLKSKSGA